MRITTQLATRTAPAGTDTSSHLVVSLTGEDTGAIRPRIGIVPVVDRSGSMSMNRKLRVVVDALGYLAGYLTPEDLLALVSFDNVIDTHLPACPADKTGAAKFAAALAELAPRMSTNLSGGIIAGIEQAKSMPSDVLARVIVLTDGQANVGIQDRAGLIALLADIPEHVSVSFLGVGTDCDHDLLSALAEAGRGSYGFIEAAARSADVLGTEIGGLLETEAHRVTVTVTARKQYLRLAAPLGLDSDGDELSQVVKVGSLLVGQTRNLVIPVTLHGPKSRHARPVTVVDVTVDGVVDDAPVQEKLTAKAHFGSPVTDPEPELADIIDLAVVAQTQRDAERKAAAGDFAGAQDLFRGVVVMSSAAQSMRDQLSGHYTNSNTYHNGSTLRVSSSHAMSGSLIGSSDAFDAFASRTLGSYTTAGQRDVAVSTANAVNSAENPRVKRQDPAVTS